MRRQLSMLFLYAEKHDKPPERKKLNKDIAISLGVSAVSAAVAAVASANDPAVALGLGVLAVGSLTNAVWLKYKTQIIDEIEDKIEDLTGVDVELDSIVDDIVEEATDIAQDLVDDGKINNSTGEVDLPLTIAAAKKMTKNQIVDELKSRKLTVSGNKAAVLDRLLSQIENIEEA